MSRQWVLLLAQYEELRAGKPPGFAADLDAVARRLGERVLIDEDQFWAVAGRYFLLPSDKPRGSCC